MVSFLSFGVPSEVERPGPAELIGGRFQWFPREDDRVAVEARVRVWHDERGWGVVDSPETPGGCWVHFSHIEQDGYRSLRGVETVELEFVPARQGRYRFTAVRVRMPGPEGTAAPEGADAYTSSLTLALDDGRVLRLDGQGHPVGEDGGERPVG
jgi:CspA family cold shock protein